MKFRDGHIWLILWIVATVVGILTISTAVNTANTLEHQKNMECLEQGGSYEYINEDSVKLVCKK